MSPDRRSFLGLTAAGAFATANASEATASAAPAASARRAVSEDALQAIAAKPVLKTDAFRSPVRIQSLALLRKGREYFIHARSTDGAEGIAVTNERAGILAPILNKQVIPYFIGKDARALEEHLWGVYRHASNYKLQGLAFWCPVAWVEFALLDMLGRIAGQSIGALLGGVIRREVKCYVASGRRDSTPEQEVDYLKKLVDETGCRAVKFRVGGRMSRNADALPGRTERLIPLARKALGDAIELHADANSSYDPPQAIAVGRMLEDVNAVYFEEPCPFDHLEDTRRVADALTLPVAGGEQEYSHWRFQWAVQNRGVDIVQPDLQYYGGLIRSLRVARMADLAGMPTTVHISGGFGFIYMLHFASVVPDIGAYQEYKQGIEEYANWFDPPLAAKEGALVVPSGPGVGIADIAAVLKGAEKIS